MFVGKHAARAVERAAAAGHAGYLVLELVVEHRQPCRGAGAAVVESTPISLVSEVSGFRSGVAVDVPPRLLWPSHPRSDAATAHESPWRHRLDRPLRPDSTAIQARADLAASLAVMWVVAQAAGQRKVPVQTPFVLGKHGPLAMVDAGAAGIGQVLVVVSVRSCSL